MVTESLNRYALLGFYSDGRRAQGICPRRSRGLRQCSGLQQSLQEYANPMVLMATA